MGAASPNPVSQGLVKRECLSDQLPIVSAAERAPAPEVQANCGACDQVLRHGRGCESLRPVHGGFDPAPLVKEADREQRFAQSCDPCVHVLATHGQALPKRQRRRVPFPDRRRGDPERIQRSRTKLAGAGRLGERLREPRHEPGARSRSCQ